MVNTKNRSTVDCDIPDLVEDEFELEMSGCGRPQVAITSALAAIQAKLEVPNASVPDTCTVTNIVFCEAMAANGLAVTVKDKTRLKPTTLRRKCEGEHYTTGKGKKEKVQRIRSIMGVAWKSLCKTPADRSANLEKIKAQAKAYGCGELVDSTSKIIADILKCKKAQIKVLKKMAPRTATYKRTLASVTVEIATKIKAVRFSAQDVPFLAAKDAGELIATLNSAEAQGTPVQPSDATLDDCDLIYTSQINFNADI